MGGSIGIFREIWKVDCTNEIAGQRDQKSMEKASWKPKLWENQITTIAAH
jgi:hypothetical protein